MLQRASSKPFCSACTRRLLGLFIEAPVSTVRIPRIHQSVALPVRSRKLHTARSLRQERQPHIDEPDKANPEPDTDLPIELSLKETQELKVRHARQVYGNNLPLDHLSVEEYKLYERLYGPPVEFTEPEDHVAVNPVDVENLDALGEEDGLMPEQNALLREAADGSFEEIELPDPIFEDDFAPPPGENYEREVHDEEPGFLSSSAVDGEVEAQDVWMQKDLEAAISLARRQAFEQGEVRGDENGISAAMQEEAYPEEDFEDSEETFERTHPYTQAGRFATFPRSVILPGTEIVEPIQRRLADTAKYEHLIEGAQKRFGGKSLQDSNATPPNSGRHFEQRPIPLSASQFSMSQLDANLFLSTIMPGAYATAMSILVEVRKRLGSSWLEELLQRPSGPRVLDAGGGGAGVLAWREVLKAEHDRIHEESGRVAKEDVNLGSSTVLAGSRELQSAVSHLLDDTVFVPRLPEFNRLRDLGPKEERDGPSRKLYDVIIAPYSIWQIEEDYMKKNHVQNLWSLLDPDGGVLILVEKGLPRGFEAIAGAREVLLSHHIKNPQADVQTRMEASEHKHTHMEEGMIVAPCTNHTKCPLYKIPGEMVGRRDFCAFKQRFERPPFLHRIHGSRRHNFEDISFSYLAVRRGRDLRREERFKQDSLATQRAFAGHEHAESPPQALALPRIMSPPLKRTGHVTFDVCTPHGDYERWTTPKSFSKRAYRDARKSQWGDLWALGAKTRIAQRAKTGLPKGEKPSKILKALDELGPEADGLRKIIAAEQEKPKKVKKGDKGWKAKIGRKEKYGNNPKTRKADKVDEVM